MNMVDGAQGTTLSLLAAEEASFAAMELCRAGSSVMGYRKACIQIRKTFM
jgi:hypothetical protein